MPATQHKLQIALDESTGAVTAVHRCTVEVAGVAVSHAREIELEGDPAEVLRGLLDANRELMEREAAELAIDHAAAVSGKQEKGKKRLKVAGSLGAVGAGAATKKGEGQ